jgi:hypothetical protein
MQLVLYNMHVYLIDLLRPVAGPEVTPSINRIGDSNSLPATFARDAWCSHN